MKLSEALTPILLAALILVVMISAALQQQSDKQTRQLLTQLTDELSQPMTVAVATPDQTQSRSDESTDPEPPPVADADADTDTGATDDTGSDTDAGTNDQAATSTDDQAADGTADSTALSELDWPTFGPTVEQVIRQLLTGQYDAVYSRFNDDMRNALPLRTLTEVMNPLRDKHGAFESIVRHSAPIVRLPEGLHAFRVTVATSKTTDEPLVFTITLDDEKRIAGLYVR